MDEGLVADVVNLRDGHGELLPCYLARPTGRERVPTVVMLHHREGWDAGSKEIARRLASEGIACALPDLHHAYAPGASVTEAAKAVLDVGGISDAHAVDVVRSTFAFVHDQAWATGQVGLIGFCSGGRQGFLAACEVPVATSVICYGPRIPEHKHTPSESSPVAGLTRAADLTGSVLAIFGSEDPIAPPDDADAITEELSRLGKEHRVRVFEGAGHAFLATDRATYDVASATQAWPEILSWLHEHLGSAATTR